MKSVKQQYIDLQEGNMSQANFMRNLRMTLPQYVTNVTSFEDSVRILKNKGILTEADTKSSEGKYKTVTGKDLYAHFKEIDNLNGHEVAQGIDWEMQCNPKLTKLEAQKIVIKKLKKNPIYYTSWDMSGVEGYKPEYMSKSSKPEDWQMQPLEKNMSNVVDKKMGMKPVKDVEKIKKDSDKGGETNKPEKGISLMSLIAKSVRGLKKMDATGEKMKKITMKEARLNDFPGETSGKIAQQIQNFIDSNPTLKQYSDEITLQSNPDGLLRYGYWETLPSDVAKALSLQFNIKGEDIDAEEDRIGGVYYMLTPKHSAGGVDLGGSFGKFKDQLKEIIRQEIAGAYGGDAMDPETGDSYINEAEDAGTFVNKIFSTAKALGLVQMNMTNTDADEKRFTANFQKEGFPPNSHGILGVAKISNGMAISLVIMADDKAKLDKLEDVIDNTKGNFKPSNEFSNKSRIYKIQNAAKDKEAFVHVFSIDLTTPAAAPVATPQAESIELAVNEALNSFRKGK